MKALISEQVGPASTLELRDIATPVEGSRELRVRVQACSINYPDVLMIEDKYQFRPARPFAPGCEIAGIVEAVGDDVEGWQVGDRVIGTLPCGGLAEQAILPVTSAFRLPPDKDPVQGAALILTYGTAYHALVDRGQLNARENLLVLGAAGGVGLAAIEVGKALGARVIAAVSDAEKAQAAHDHGAEEVLIYPSEVLDKAGIKDLTAKMKKLLGDQGADVVLDPVGGTYCEAALGAVAWGGRYLVIGFPAGIPAPPLNRILLKSCDLRGVFWGAFADRYPDINRRNIEQLVTWWAEKRISPPVGRVWNLSDGGQAIEWLASRQAIGKAVVRI